MKCVGEEELLNVDWAPHCLAVMAASVMGAVLVEGTAVQMSLELVVDLVGILV